MRAWVAAMVFLGVAGAGCVAKIAYHPTAPPRMSRTQALEQVKALLPRGEPLGAGHAFSEFSAYEDRIEFMYQTRTTGGRVKGLPVLYAVSYQAIDPTVQTAGGWIWVELASTYTFGAASLRFTSMEDARAFADALFLLKSHPANFVPPVDPGEEAAFIEQARRYRALVIKPELPEEARRFKVQAEFAIEQKRFEDGVERYQDGLRIAPMWPEGHYDCALVLGELSRYAEAIRAMKKYLLLAPDAPDARAAQDRIYQWESAAPRGK